MMLYISDIDMHPSGDPDILLEGLLILNHTFIVNNVKLIRGKHRLFLKFPVDRRDHRVVYPLSQETYQYMLNLVTEYYAKCKSDQTGSDFFNTTKQK